MNTVPNHANFLSNISKGRWNLVLEQISKMYIPKEKLIFLYEQIIYEMVELREIDTAKELFQTSVMKELLDTDQTHYFHINEIIESPFFDSSKVYEGTSKSKRRNAIITLLSNEISSVPANRLMTIIGESLKWRKANGTLPPNGPYNLFEGNTRQQRVEDERIPKRNVFIFIINNSFIFFLFLFFLFFFLFYCFIFIYRLPVLKYYQKIVLNVEYFLQMVNI